MVFQKTITIAPDSAQPLTVNRLGYGTMRLTGAEIYGEPPNRLEALEILKSTEKNGINFLDTADYYGDDVTNRLIAEALYPYQNDLVICTKVGAARTRNKGWITFDSPENLRKSVERNLQTLKLEQLKLVHFRVMPGSDVPFRESMDAMFALQKEGKILHVGVSNVNRDELIEAMTIGNIATVENMYGHSQRTTSKMHNGENRGGGEVLDICEKYLIPLIPFFSLLTSFNKRDIRIKTLAAQLGVTETQLNLSWLLHKSPMILPIPGTSSLAHFRENLQSLSLDINLQDFQLLDG